MRYLVIIALLVMSVPQAQATSITVADGKITLSTGSLGFQLSSSDGSITKVVNLPGGKYISDGRGGIYFIDGKSGTEIFPKGITVTESQDTNLEYLLDMGEPDIQPRCNIEVKDTGVLWAVSITNQSKRLRMFEVRLGLPIDFSDSVYNYWDGYDQHFESPVSPIYWKCNAESNLYAVNALPTLNKKGKRAAFHPTDNHRLGNVCIFPMNCLWNREFGIAIGVSPMQPVSYYSGGVQPSVSPWESFYYALKFVVLPGETVTQDFVLYSFDGESGYRAALQRYYDCFPEAFAQRGDIPSRAYLPATVGFLGTLINIHEHELGDLWEEFCRRYYVGWMWLYAPFQETGEWFPSEERYTPEGWLRQNRWTKESKREWLKTSIAARRMGTYADFVNYINRVISYSQKACSIGWYVIPQRCSKDLAQRYHPEAVVLRWYNETPYYRNSGPTGHPMHTMCALNNSFGEKSKEDIREIIELAGPDGIAFDNAMAFHHYTGTSMINSAGKAFRDGKPYIVNNLAYRDLERFVHNLDVPASTGCKPAVFTNGPYNIGAAMYSDASLIEYHPYHPSNMVSSFAMLRYLIGPKEPINFKVHGRSVAEAVVREESLQEDSISLVLNQRLHSLLTLFRWGGFPTIREALGSPDLIDALPTLIKLFRAGWSPITNAVFNGDRLWVERFGEGLQSHFSIINYTEQRCSDSVGIKKDIGEGLLFFESIYGDPVTTSVQNDTSKVNLSIRPVWMSVMKPFLQVMPESRVSEASASITHGYEDGRKVCEIMIHLTTPLKAAIVLPIESGADDLRVMVNGIRVEELSSNEESVAFRCKLRRRNRIQLSYIEEIQIRPDPQAVLTCKYIHRNILKFVIRNEDETPERVAERIQNYFRYYALADDFERYYQSNCRTRPPDTASIGRVRIGKNGSRETGSIDLSVSPDLRTKGRITVDLNSHVPFRIRIEGSSKEHLNEAVARCLRLLDEKYVRYGYDAAFKKSWDRPGLLANEREHYQRMGWEEFLDYMNNKRRGHSS
jgi:hypothetical protein